MSAVWKTQRPFRLQAPVTPENDLQAAVVAALRLLVAPPAMWSCFPAGHVALSGQASAKLARMGLARGWPDLLVVHNGIFGIELKRQGGRLSQTRVVRSRGGRPRVVEGQREVFPRLEAAGMHIAVCETIDEVLVALAGWGVPLREGCV